MPEKKEGTEVGFLGKTMVFGVKSLNIVVNTTQNLLFQSIKLLKKTSGTKSGITLQRPTSK